MDGEAIGVLVVFASLVSFAGLGVGIAAARRRERARRGTTADAGVGERHDNASVQALKMADLARHYGVALNEERLLRFERGGVAITLEIEQTEDSDGVYRKTRLEVGDGLVALELSAEGTRSGGDVEIGDANFDGIACIKGEPTLALAVLTPEARRRVSAALMRGWKVLRERGAYRAVLQRGGDYLGDMIALVEEGIGLAAALAPPADVPERLMQRLQSEPQAPVRHRLAAGLLLTRDPGAQLARLAALTDPGLRLLAGERLRAPSLWASLTEGDLASLVLHEDDLVALAACGGLGRRGTAASIPALNRAKIERPRRSLEIEAAVRAIRERTIATPGALALTDSEAGLALIDE